MARSEGQTVTQSVCSRASAAASIWSFGIPNVVRGDWHLFGSWAISLQSRWVARFPNDIDVALDDPADLDRVRAGWAVQQSGVVVTGSPAHEIVFANRRKAVTALWQNVAVSVHGRPLAQELLNWAHHPTVSHRADAIPSGVERSGVRPLTVRIAPTPMGPVQIANLEYCFAQKWTRLASVRSGGRRHTRWHDAADLYDLAILESARCDHDELRRTMSRLVADRNLVWPALLGEPPAEWADDWDRNNYQSGVGRPNPAETIGALNTWWLTICG